MQWQVPSLLMLAIKASKLPTDKSPVYQFIHDFKDVRTLLAESLAAFDAGRLPGDLGDTPAMVDKGEDGHTVMDRDSVCGCATMRVQLIPTALCRLQPFRPHWLVC